jgi:hypothetical protein
MTKRIPDSNLHSLGWEISATDGRWYWTGGDSGLSAKVASNTSRITVLEAGSGGGGGGLWTDNGDGTITFTGIAKASDFVTL